LDFVSVLEKTNEPYNDAVDETTICTFRIGRTWSGSKNIFGTPCVNLIDENRKLTTLPKPHAPKTTQDNKAILGTKLPTSEDRKSPFSNNTVEDVARWLKERPNNLDLDGHHFCGARRTIRR
jgi:hypothetical protein